MIPELTGGWSVVAARACGFLILLPSVEGAGSFSRVIIATILGITFASTATLATDFSPTWSMLIFEFVIGIAFAIPLVLLLDAISSTGEYIDAMRGQLIGNINDPVSMSLQSSAAVAAKMGSLAVIISSGGAEAVLETITESYGVIPAGGGTLALLPKFEVTGLLSSIQNAFLWPLATLILCGGIFLAIELAAMGIARLTSGLYLNELQYAVKTVVMVVIVALVLRGVERGGGESIRQLANSATSLLRSYVGVDSTSEAPKTSLVACEPPGPRARISSRNSPSAGIDELG